MLSIITPVLNGAQFIEKLIQSVAALNIPYEHIIVDGGSTDETLEIVSRYPKIRMLSQQNPAGMYAAIQEGFEAAEGEFITWINSDDWILTDGYEAMYRLIASGKYDLIYGGGSYYYVENAKFENFKAKACGKFLFLNRVFPCLQPATIYRKSIFGAIGGFNSKKFKIAGDLDFFVRFAKASTKPFARLNRTCVVFLKYGESLGDRSHQLYLEEKENLPKPKHGRLGHLLAKIIYKSNL
ncbi:glycosyltransferase [Akkermansiaceae bacterium]|nr:glycosyltransferase [Akkermansiaceae bacterium]